MTGHTREVHAAILDAHQGERGLLVHQYRRCGFSGAGNCCCGRQEESVLHPHPFTRSASSRERDAWRCVCSKAEDHPCHVTAPAQRDTPAQVSESARTPS